MVATMASGAYFGDIALIQASTGDSNVGVRTASIRAITYCELFVLTKDDVIYVWDRSPELRKAMEAVMMEEVLVVGLLATQAQQYQQTPQYQQQLKSESY